MNIMQQEISMTQNGEARADSGQGRSCAGSRESGGALIVNADDWGRDIATTNRTLECAQRGAVSSVSAMVFMEDSERAAALARLHGVDAGLHLNFTLAYSALACPARLKEHQGKLARFLSAHRLAPALFNPRLSASFEYVVKAQFDEFERLFGTHPCRADGHHHMHLSANVIRQKLLPEGIVVRRNLSFRPGEKGYMNRLYRRLQDERLARRYRVTDLFFDLQPIEPLRRLSEILELSNRFDIEVETHPIRDDEYSFLMEGGLARCCAGVAVSRGYTLRFCKSTHQFREATLTRQALR